MNTGQYVKVLSAEENYEQHIGQIGKVLYVDQVPFDDIQAICIVEFAHNEVAPFYERELGPCKEPISAEPSERYISGISSTCGNCGYEETIEIPEQAEPQDIIQAMQAVRGKCPECQERVRKLAEKQIDGLSDEEILNEIEPEWMEDNNQ